jgi:hypothetical protein
MAMSVINRIVAAGELAVAARRALEEMGEDLRSRVAMLEFAIDDAERRSRTRAGDQILSEMVRLRDHLARAAAELVMAISPPPRPPIRQDAAVVPLRPASFDA